MKICPSLRPLFAARAARGATLALCGLFALTSTRAALDPTRDKILYQVATAHLDTQWNWTILDTINTYIPATLTNNFTLFGKYTNYVFSFEGAFRYKLAREYYPAWYSTMSNYVASGQWRVAGSAVDAGDVNIPSPESLMRQVLYANGFWKQQFGKTSTDIFLPDCFGFGYALPSIAAHCGLSGFSSQKLSWGSAIPIPFQNVGKWVGPDGGSVVAALQPGGYNSSITTNLAYDLSELNRITNMGAATGLYLDYRYFGTGDTGGSPNDSSVNWLQQAVQTTNGYVNVLSVASDQLFRDLTPANISHLPVYQGELLMRTHGTGCYTSHPEMKQYNRQNEQRADGAERLAVLADWLQGGGTYPQEKLTRAWERFLWHQFHDDLTGTSIPTAYTFSWNDELLSLNEFASEERNGAGVLAQALDTTALGVPLMVYNPLSVPREDVVEAVATFPTAAPAAVRVFDAGGNEVPSQMGTPAGNSVPVTFLASVPAAGAAVFDVRPAATPCSLTTGLSITTAQIQNGRYRVQLDANGNVASIFDKANSRELLSAPIRWAFLADSSTAWPAWEIQYSSSSAAPYSYLSGPASVQVLESGPARVSLGITRFNAGSAFTERIRLAPGGAADSLEWDVSLNWNTAQTLLKLVFPLTVGNTNATYDLGLGTIQRTNSSANTYEVPAQQWADLTSTNAAYGVTVMDDCRYGWDKPDNNTLRLTVLHSPGVGGSYVYQATNGFGSHRLGFAVMGHTNDWRSGQSSWAAARFNQRLQAFQTSSHAGGLGKTFSFILCNNSNVMVKALKKAETSNEVVVRLQELTGQPQNLLLSCATAITAARQITGAEEPLATLTPAGGSLALSLGAYQPMTLALTLQPPAALVSKPVSLAVSLPFNLDAISTDANRTDGNFDSGFTYPAECLPASLVRDGVAFQFGPANDGALNAVACQGQTISLAAGYDRLYLLAAAASNDVSASFSINGQVTNLTVQHFSGFIGQWNPPFLKKDEVGYVCTHRHTAGGANDAYRFCYLFKYRLDLPPGATTLTLPNSPNLRLFAASLARNTTADTVASGGGLNQVQLPWANAGRDRTVNAGIGGTAMVRLDGSASAAPEGSIVAYAWSENGTLLATGVQPLVALGIGIHPITLTVTDNLGGMSQAMVTITVLTPLNVTVTAAPTNASSAPLTVQFTGQAAGGIPPGAFDTTDDQQGTMTAQGQNSGASEVATNAFDNTSSTKWLDFATNNPTTRASWIQYQYANGKQFVVTNYTITSANDAPERDPANWRLQGSNDNGTNWTTLDTRTGQSFGARFQKQTFSTANTTAYNIYRLQIDRVADPSSANSVQLAELEFLGTPTYAYWWSFGDGTGSTLQNPLHTFTNNGNYLVVLGVTFSIYTGTNSILITIGPALSAVVTATPTNGTVPLTVHFGVQAGGGNGGRAPYDLTDDQRGTITAQGDNPPNETAPKAFDNLATTKWLDFANSFPATRASWLQYQFADGQQGIVTRYTLTSANDATAYPGRNPANWRLLGSNDGGASWTVLDIRTNQAFTANYQKLSYLTTNTSAWAVYRLQIDSISNAPAANCMQMAELELIGTPAYTYAWVFGDGTGSSAQNPQHTYTNYGTYNATVTVSDGAASLTYGVTVNVMPLTLGLGQSGGGSVVLTWPDWADAFTLYSTTNFAAPVLWSPVTNAISHAGNLLNVTIPTASGNRFFQLRGP